MRLAYVDPVGGLAGDMLVAALIDAGAPWDGLQAALAGLDLPGWTARTERVWRGPFAATRFVVDLAPTPDGGQDGPTTAGQAHAHTHDHAVGPGRGHDHHHDHAVSGAEGDPSRRWPQIRAMLEAAPLPARARDRALATFSALAAAEARVHGISPEDVHFHEVGAVDSIVDITGAALALELLGIDELVVGPLPLGVGHTLGDHGWTPLPAPATVELLRGFSVEDHPVRGESVTPTGAALAAALMRSGSLPPMRVERVGVGAGTRDPAGHPNVVRVLVGEGHAGAPTSVVELSAELDGITGEQVPALVDSLLAAGALDAWTAPIAMKKGRPGVLVTALCEPGGRAAVGDALFATGVTLGYRWALREREVLARRIVTVATAFGPVRVKLGEHAGRRLRAAPEHADCARLAGQAGVGIAEVYAAALASLGATQG